MAPASWLVSGVLIGALACATTKKDVGSGEMSRPPWPVLTDLPQLDASNVATLPGSDAKVFRTEAMLAFDSGVPDDAKHALFVSQQLTVLGQTPSGTFFVRFADRGSSFQALEAFMDSLRAQPGVQTVAPINFTPLKEVGLSEEPSRDARQPDPAPGLVTLYKSLNGGPPSGAREVIRESTRWRAVWNGTCCSRSAVVPFPETDFTRYMVLFAADPRGSGGDSVVIDQLTQTAGLLRVRVISYQHCNPTDIRTRPVHLVRVPRREGEVMFENRAIRGPNCL